MYVCLCLCFHSNRLPSIYLLQKTFSVSYPSRIPSSVPLSYLLTFSCLFNKCTIILTNKAQTLYDDQDKSEHYTNGTSPHTEALTIAYIIELHIHPDAGTWPSGTWLTEKCPWLNVAGWELPVDNAKHCQKISWNWIMWSLQLIKKTLWMDGTKCGDTHP